MKWISLIGLIVAWFGLISYLWYKYLIDTSFGPGRPIEVDFERHSKYVYRSKIIGGIAGAFFIITSILRYKDALCLDTLFTFFGITFFVGSMVLIMGLVFSFFPRDRFSQLKKKMEKVEEEDLAKFEVEIKITRVIQIVWDSIWCTGLLLCMLGIWYRISFGYIACYPMGFL